MDIYKAILELKAEKKRLDRAIAALEQDEGGGRAHTGRRTWNAEARRAAAERMKKYWEQRKLQAGSQVTT
jgi:peptidoglycan hydrolase CwlO-like protein